MLKNQRDCYGGFFGKVGSGWSVWCWCAYFFFEILQIEAKGYSKQLSLFSALSVYKTLRL